MSEAPEQRWPEPRPDLGVHDGYHSAQVAVTVRLNTNESPYPPPRGWFDALVAEASGMSFNRYPDRSALELRSALARLHGVRPEQVFAGNGSNEVLQCICLAYGGAGRRALMFEPTYALHSHIAHLTGTGMARAQRGEGFELAPAVAAASVRQERPAIVFLCSPNNPTGISEPPETVAAVLEAADGALVVVDEAYGQFAPWSALEMVGPRTPLVVVRTYSKTWSMAGLRLGYLVGPERVVEVLQRVALPYHLDTLKQAAGRLALQFSAQMEQHVAAIVSERRRMVDALRSMPVDVWPSDANFVLWRPRFKPGPRVWQELVERSVLVRDISSLPGLAGYLRTTVGTPSENGTFLAALAEVLG